MNNTRPKSERHAEAVQDVTQQVNKEALQAAADLGSTYAPTVAQLEAEREILSFGYHPAPHKLGDVLALDKDAGRAYYRWFIEQMGDRSETLRLLMNHLGVHYSVDKNQMGEFHRYLRAHIVRATGGSAVLPNYLWTSIIQDASMAIHQGKLDQHPTLRSKMQTTMDMGARNHPSLVGFTKEQFGSRFYTSPSGVLNAYQWSVLRKENDTLSEYCALIDRYV